MKRILMAEELRNAEDDADDLAAAEEDYQVFFELLLQAQKKNSHVC